MDRDRSLTRKEFDEVIRRATELATHESESGEGELDEEEVYRIAGEVGIQERYVRRALAEFRGRSPRGGPLDRLFGPDVVRSSRVVPGAPAGVARKLDEFLVAGQLLQPVRRGPSVLHYRPAVDWASQIARAASATSSRYYVASAKSVEIQLTELEEEGSSLVEMVVDPGTRNDSVVGGALGGVAGGAAVAIGAGAAVAALAPVALAVVVGGILGGGSVGGIVWLAGRHHRSKLMEVRSEVEGILDRLEAGESLEPPPASWRRWVKRHFHGVARDLMGDEEELE